MPSASSAVVKNLLLYVTHQDTISVNCGPKNVTFPLAGSLSKDITRPGNLKEGMVAISADYAYKCVTC